MFLDDINRQVKILRENEFNNLNGLRLGDMIVMLENVVNKDSPITYVTSSWRNPEIQKVLRILSILGSDNDKPLPHYD